MSCSNVYRRGAPVQLIGMFRDPAPGGDPVDPSVVTCRYRTPAGVETVESLPGGTAIVREEMGRYVLTITATIEGIWRYRWSGTGAWASAEEAFFRVTPSQFS